MGAGEASRDALQRRVTRPVDVLGTLVLAGLAGSVLAICGASPRASLLLVGVVAVRGIGRSGATRLVSGLGVVVVTAGSLLASGPTRVATVVASVVVATATVLVGRPRGRRIILANLVVLGALLVALEVGLRLSSASAGSSGYQSIELYRQGRDDGPDEVTSPIVTYDGALRRTVDQPITSPRRILLFGGSTTLCAEVDDAGTWPSILQRLLGGAVSRWRVENHGVSATTAANRAEALRSVPDLGPADVVLFFVGVNDAGASFTQRENPAVVVREIPRLGTLIRRLSEHSRIADGVFRLLVFGGVRTSADARREAVESFRDALATADAAATTAGARFVPVLQPHLFTRATPSDYEQGLAALYSPALGDAVEAIYPGLWDEIRRYPAAIDARAAMDGLTRSPYLDWHHVDERGNTAIAQFVWERLEWD